MSEHLGRAILPDESVHHKNGVKHDNDFENLELRVRSHGQGISIEDALQWAHTIINRYGKE
jgi:hypothetical protein